MGRCIFNFRFLILNSRRVGFTLIEILLVVSIIGVMLAVTLPVSYGMYMSHKSSLKAEEVLMFVSSLRRDSFLYGDEWLLQSKDGILFYANDVSKGFEGVYVQADRPIRFYNNGTTSGGDLKVYVDGYSYVISISPPFGNLYLRKGE